MHLIVFGMNTGNLMRPRGYHLNTKPQTHIQLKSQVFCSLKMEPANSVLLQCNGEQCHSSFRQSVSVNAYVDWLSEDCAYIFQKNAYAYISKQYC